MSTLFHKLGFAARLMLLLAVALGTFAASATPAAASRIMPPTTTVGKLALFVYDNDQHSKGPISGALVKIYDMTGVMVMKGLTDEQGKFIAELDEAKYVVSAEAAGYLPSKTVVGVQGGTEVKLGLNAEIGAYMGILVVRVWDAPGPAPKPLAGAVVVVFDMNGSVAAKGVTNELGMFSAKLNVGSYKINATAAGYKPSWGEGVVLAKQQTIAVMSLEKEALVSPMLINVYEGSAIRHLPIAGATILVYSVDGQLVAKGATDKLGKFGTTLTAGLYSLEISATGYQTVRIAAKLDPPLTFEVDVSLYKEPLDR